MAVETRRVRRTNRDSIDAPDRQLGGLTQSICVCVCVFVFQCIHSCVHVCLLEYARASFQREKDNSAMENISFPLVNHQSEKEPSLMPKEVSVLCISNYSDHLLKHFSMVTHMCISMLLSR